MPLVSLEKTMEERIQLLHNLRNCVTFFWGQMGTGKSTNAVAIAHWMRDLFDLPVVQVGTSLGLRPPFGPFSFMSKEDFIKQLILITQIAEEAQEQNIAEDDIPIYLEWCRKERGLRLYKAILLVDELQKICNSRKANNGLNMAMIEFIAQLRHYHCSILAMAPNYTNVDGRVQEQIRWHCKPSENPRTRWYTNIMKGSRGTIRLDVYGPHYQGRYPDDPDRMFNSWAFTGFNTKSLEKVLEKDV